VLDIVADRILGLGSTRLRVAIDGRTASGKTTFGDELADRLSERGRPVLRAGLDDFKRPWGDRHLYDRESAEGFYRNAYDYENIRDLLLRPAGRSGSGRCVLCSIDPLTHRDHTSVITQAEADAILIVDGQFACRPELNDFWDFRVWLDVDPDTSNLRGANRNSKWLASDAESLQQARYIPADEIYRSEVQPERIADLRIDNLDVDQPRFLV
jgi:uridine kinase